MEPFSVHADRCRLIRSGEHPFPPALTIEFYASLCPPGQARYTLCQEFGSYGFLSFFYHKQIPEKDKDYSEKGFMAPVVVLPHR